jgi:L-threonylcarbamoyladenylate synthase
MQIINIAQADNSPIIKALKAGGLVIFPCETVYGAAVDASDSKGVLKLNQYKQRPVGKPYAIMVSDIEMAKKYAVLNQTAENLYKNFLPGPLTIISQGKHQLAPGIESEQGTLGVRIPDYAFMLKLISQFGGPIAATSANASYQKRPYKIADILDNISEKQKALIDLMIDAGELPHNEPSTVIDTNLDDAVILRQGEIKLGNENQVVSRSEENTHNIGKEMWQKYENYSGKRAIIFALEGPMGAGKTQFTKGLAKAMGIKDEIVSPTFNLELQYLTPIPSPILGEGKLTSLIHMDAWRLQNGEELENLGIKQNISDKSVMAIEWADRVADTIRKYNEEAVIIWVKIEYGKEENERKIFWQTI